jgi:hypothetical protein
MFNCCCCFWNEQEEGEISPLLKGEQTTESGSVVKTLAKSFESKEGSSSVPTVTVDRFEQDRFIGRKKSVKQMASAIKDSIEDERKLIVVEEQFWRQNSIEKAMQSHKSHTKIIERLKTFRPNQIFEETSNSVSVNSKKMWIHIDETLEHLQELCGKVVARYEKMMKLTHAIEELATEFLEKIDSRNGNMKEILSKLSTTVTNLVELCKGTEELSHISSELNGIKIVGGNSLKIRKQVADQCEEEKRKSPEYKAYVQYEKQLKSINAQLASLELKARQKSKQMLPEDVSALSKLKENEKELEGHMFKLRPEVERIDSQIKESRELLDGALKSVLGKVTYSKGELGHAFSVISIVDELNGSIDKFQQNHWELNRQVSDFADLTVRHLREMHLPVRNMTSAELIELLGKDTLVSESMKRSNIDGERFLQLSVVDIAEKILKPHYSGLFLKIHIRRLIRLQEEEKNPEQRVRKAKEIMIKVKNDIHSYIKLGKNVEPSS